MEKRYTYKIYDRNNNFITTWQDVNFTSFRSEINGSFGSLSLKVARSFDNFGEGYDVKVFNKIEVWATDIDTPEQLIYSGYIETYIPQIDGANESITIECQGFLNRYRFWPYKIANQVTIHHNGDPSNIVKNIIDQVRAEYADDPAALQINYTADSIDLTGTTVFYDFVNESALDALLKCQQLAPSNWYFFVDANNTLWFKALDTTAKHNFTFGRDFSRISATKSVAKLRNNLIFWNGISGINFSFIHFSASMTASGNSYLYVDLTSVSNYTIQSGDYLAYDIMWLSPDDYIAVDLTCTDASTLRDALPNVDQMSLSANPNTDISAFAYNKTYHRKISLSALIGKTIANYDIACENNKTAIKTALVGNIYITDIAGTVRKIIYDAVNPFTTYGVHIASNGTISEFSSNAAITISKLYTDATSTSDNGYLFEKQTDGRVTVTATSDKWGTAFINANKDIDIKTELTIIDNNVDTMRGYNIESINPGDTCKLINIKDTNNTFKDSMAITAVNYTPNTATLELESVRDSIEREFAKLKSDLDTQQYTSGQPDYTS